MSNPYIITDESVTVLINGQPRTVDNSQTSYREVIESIKNNDWERVEALTDKVTAVQAFANGAFEVKDNEVYYNGDEVHNHVVNRILDFIDAGLDAQPLLNFLEKLLQNPSKGCVDRLFRFLEQGNMPIAPDGDFYAYKAVRHDWMDKHSGKFSNQIGDIVEVSRNQVDDDHNCSCSYGLHAGSVKYVESFGSQNDNLIIVKINPKDAVTVPEGENNKLRCCRYEVTGLYREPLNDTFYDHQTCCCNDYDEDYDDDINDDEDLGW